MAQETNMLPVQREGQAIARDIAISVLLAVVVPTWGKRADPDSNFNPAEALRLARALLDQAMWSAEPDTMEAARVHLDTLFSTATALTSVIPSLT
jgi:hypothetical protein